MLVERVKVVHIILNESMRRLCLTIVIKAHIEIGAYSILCERLGAVDI